MSVGYGVVETHSRPACALGVPGFVTKRIATRPLRAPSRFFVERPLPHVVLRT